MPKKTLSRRKLLARAGQGAVLIPLVTMTEQNAWALEKIGEDHPTASALGYIHDATKVDTAKFPKRAGAEGAKQFCYNCSQYKETEAEWGTCTIFPNFLVAKDGWCNVWVPIP